MAQQDLIERVGYLSTPTHSWSENELQELEAYAVANNKRLNITGVLLATPDRFLQILEGAPEVIYPLMEKIGFHPGHRDLRVFSTHPDSNRLSGKWMAVTTDHRLPDETRKHLDDIFSSFEQQARENHPLTPDQISFLGKIAQY